MANGRFITVGRGAPGNPGPQGPSGPLGPEGAQGNTYYSPGYPALIPQTSPIYTDPYFLQPYHCAISTIHTSSPLNPLTPHIIPFIPRVSIPILSVYVNVLYSLGDNSQKINAGIYSNTVYTGTRDAPEVLLRSGSSVFIDVNPGYVIPFSSPISLTPGVLYWVVLVADGPSAVYLRGYSQGNLVLGFSSVIQENKLVHSYTYTENFSSVDALPHILDPTKLTTFPDTTGQIRLVPFYVFVYS